MLQFLKGQLADVEEELRQYYTDRRKASIETIGSYDLMIKRKNEERSKLLLDIENEEVKIKTPNEIKVYFYIIVSTKGKVKENVKEYACHINDVQYHDSDLTQWKPFFQNDIIDILLADVKKDYNFEPIYIDGYIAPEVWADLDDEIENSIAIIDLFSLDENNKKIASKFDTKKAGLLTPLCRTLHQKLCEFANNVLSDFNVLTAKKELNISCDFFAEDLAGAVSFKRELRSILKKKFPIKNQSTSASSVRGLQNMISLR